MRLLVCFVFFLCSFLLKGQRISGSVLDSGGEPIMNAHIIIDNTDKIYFSNEKGEFEIFVTDKSKLEIEISHIGYKSLKIIIQDIKRDTSLGNLYLESLAVLTDELIIKGLRASAKTPISHTIITNEEIAKENLAQDIPYLLRHSPSVIVSSDAGNGVGYSSMRIRGTDQSRINVTINGIPYNDAESQQVFWVDLPDIASSLKDIQIQRGLGSSTHGAGAFGGSIHLNSLTIDPASSIEFANSFGSYNTHKHSLTANSGILNNHWNFVARFSLINSDGYIERASSDLKSYYAKASYINSKTAIHLTHFSGKEKTYQSWYGTPEARAKNNEEGIQAFIDRNFLSDYEANRLRDSDRRYNFYEYENQIDDYKQDHYSMHFTHQMNEGLQLSTAIHMTKGNGFYEEFKNDDLLSNYEIEDQIIDSELVSSSDLVRRRWLDNIFYGGILNVEYKISENSEWILGSGYHIYSGDHFGEIIDIDRVELQNIPYPYYKSDSEKKDFNIYSKVSASLDKRWFGYLDLQFRKVDYETLGKDNDLKDFNISRSFSFFNPKVGIQFSIDDKQSVFAYLGIGNREPDRNDFIDQFPNAEPKPERLLNLELGYNYNHPNVSTGVGLYWMNYQNQLVLSGDLNDVGAPLRLNVPDSYRAGLEWEVYLKMNSVLSFSSSLNLSLNKIKLFKETLYDYSSAETTLVINEYTNSNISFSPNTVASFGVDLKPLEPLQLSIISKYVGKQFLDNTSNEERVIDPYFIGDVILQYKPTFLRSFKELSFTFQLNNLWNALYSANGYTYSYIYGDLITENFLYPQAERNFMMGLQIKL